MKSVWFDFSARTITSGPDPLVKTRNVGACILVTPTTLAISCCPCSHKERPAVHFSGIWFPQMISVLFPSPCFLFPYCRHCFHMDRPLFHLALCRFKNIVSMDGKEPWITYTDKHHPCAVVVCHAIYGITNSLTRTDNTGWGFNLRTTSGPLAGGRHQLTASSRSLTLSYLFWSTILVPWVLPELFKSMSLKHR